MPVLEAMKVRDHWYSYRWSELNVLALLMERFQIVLSYLYDWLASLRDQYFQHPNLSFEKFAMQDMFLVSFVFQAL